MPAHPSLMRQFRSHLGARETNSLKIPILATETISDFPHDVHDTSCAAPAAPRGAIFKLGTRVPRSRDFMPTSLMPHVVFLSPRKVAGAPGSGPDRAVPIPTKPPVYNGMIAPRDSRMMPPLYNEIIPPGAPRASA